MDNDKYKEKLLLTNVKNIKSSQYYHKVIEELKERCSERRKEFPVKVERTRQKFKRCINICIDAVMKVKTPSGIKHFQQDKEIGSCFGKLLPISSMDICQHQQAIEPGKTAPESNGQEANLKKAMMMMFVKKRQVKVLPQAPLMEKRKKETCTYTSE